MKFLAVAALLAGAAIAAPTSNTGGGLHCPPGLYSDPQCCSDIVDGVVGLDCEVPDAGDFQEICKNKGKEAACCEIPVAVLSILCKKAVDT